MAVKADWVDGDLFTATAANLVAAVCNVGVSGSAAGTPAALTLWVGTEAQYAAISEKDASTVYITTP